MLPESDTTLFPKRRFIKPTFSEAIDDVCSAALRNDRRASPETFPFFFSLPPSLKTQVVLRIAIITDKIGCTYTLRKSIVYPRFANIARSLAIARSRAQRLSRYIVVKSQYKRYNINFLTYRRSGAFALIATMSRVNAITKQ